MTGIDLVVLSCEITFVTLALHSHCVQNHCNFNHITERCSIMDVMRICHVNDINGLDDARCVM